MDYEERLRRIKEHEPKVKVTLVSSRELTEEDFIGMPMTKENLDRYQAWKVARAQIRRHSDEKFHRRILSVLQSSMFYCYNCQRLYYLDNVRIIGIGSHYQYKRCRKCGSAMVVIRRISDGII